MDKGWKERAINIMKSIYESICENIKDGLLAEDFVLPPEDKESILWAPGAMDGVYIPHGASRYRKKCIK